MFWQVPHFENKSEAVGLTMRGSMLHCALMMLIGLTIEFCGTETGENAVGEVTLTVTRRFGPTGTLS